MKGPPMHLYDIQVGPKNFCDRSRTQIAANHGKFCSKNFGDHVFEKLRVIASARPKNNGDHFGGEIVAVFGFTIFVNA